MIQIIRTFWGNQEKTWKEVPATPLFTDEVVFVWGLENESRFKSMGYKTVLMNRGVTQPEYSTIYDHFAHKLRALSKAEKMYDEYLFLDWDVHIIKPIDDDFWNIIRSGNDVQCTTYGYPLDYETKILQHIKDNPQKDWIKKLDPNTYPWISVQNELMEKYSWKWEDLQLVPNFCFFYSRNNQVASKLLEIYVNDGIKTCIEEYCMYIYADCSLEEFINKYEPIVIRGREDDCYHFDLIEDDTMRRINKFIDTLISKNLYLKHV